MLNHYRTLLANLSPGALDGITGFAEEPIPSSFVPVTVTSAIQRVRRVLFGTSPDREFVNYRTRQIMTVLRASRYNEYLTYHDTRVCYRDENISDLPHQVDGPEANIGSLVLVGKSTGQDAAGFFRFTYTVTVLDESTVKLQRVNPAGTTFSLDYALDGTQASGLLSLHGSGLNFRLFQPAVGDFWNVTLFLVPSKDLGSLIASLDVVGDDVLSSLFGQDDKEPYQSFANLWNFSTSLPDRLMGIVSAMVFRTHERIGR